METCEETSSIAQRRDDGGLDEGDSSGNGKYWSDLGYILKITLSSFAVGLYMRHVRKGRVKNNFKFRDI